MVPATVRVDVQGAPADKASDILRAATECAEKMTEFLRPAPVAVPVLPGQHGKKP